MSTSTMSQERLLELLGRGAVSGGPDGLLADPPDKYNPLADPAGAEELAAELAARVPPGATVVVVWEDPEDVVLGHVVARTLGLAVVRAYNADGLVGHSAGLPEGAAALLVTDAVRDPSVVRAVSGLVQRQGGALATTAVLIGTGALRDATTDAGEVVALVQARPAAEEA